MNSDANRRPNYSKSILKTRPRFLVKRDHISGRICESCGDIRRINSDPLDNISTGSHHSVRRFGDTFHEDV
jgi:hypothetical protein